MLLKTADCRPFPTRESHRLSEDTVLSLQTPYQDAKRFVSL
jgi:hypothetical protein